MPFLFFAQFQLVPIIQSCSSPCAELKVVTQPTPLSKVCYHQVSNPTNSKMLLPKYLDFRFMLPHPAKLWSISNSLPSLRILLSYCRRYEYCCRIVVTNIVIVLPLQILLSYCCLYEYCCRIAAFLDPYYVSTGRGSSLSVELTYTYNLALLVAECRNG